MVFVSIPSKFSLILLSNESTAASTAIMEKIPTVTPKSERKVLSLLLFSAVIAKEKLSFNNLR
jgi:hypothetical protein